jgi:hypothetical protein
MRRLLWPLGLVGAFSLGLIGAELFRHGPAGTEEIERLRTQVNTLQARLRAREMRPPAAQGARTGSAGWDLGDGLATAADASGAAPSLALDARGRARGESQTGSATPERAGRVTAVSAPSVQAALDRFYQYLDERNWSGGPGRWQRLQQLAEELRGMGSAGADALMKVLANGTTSDERRVAAQLLGDLKVAAAVPLLQGVLDQDSDILLRRAAASGLRRLQMPETVPVLDSLVANPGEDRFVRMSAASGLAQMGKPQGVQSLMQIFDESTADGRGRDMAFRALNSLNDDRALPFMRQLVNSNVEPSYRLQAIRFVAAQGDTQAIQSLQQVMRSPTEQPSIRDAATQAHAALTGK